MPQNLVVADGILMPKCFLVKFALRDLTVPLYIGKFCMELLVACQALCNKFRPEVHNFLGLLRLVFLVPGLSSILPFIIRSSTLGTERK
jgi:hypothetical protein